MTYRYRESVSINAGKISLKFQPFLFVLIIIVSSIFLAKQCVESDWLSILFILSIYGIIISSLIDKDLIVMMLLTIGFFLGYMKMVFGSWTVYLIPDVLAASAIFVWLSERFTKHLAILPQSPLTKPIVILCIYCFIELLNPMSSLLRSLAGLRSWILYLFLYFVGFCSLRNVHQVKKIYLLLILLGTITAIFGIWQWYNPALFAQKGELFTQYSESSLWIDKQGHSIFRAYSTFVLPGTFGINMAFVMLIALSIVLSPKIKFIFRLLMIPCLGLMSIGLFFSGSRAPFVILFFGMSIILFLKWKVVTSVWILFIMASVTIGSVYFIGSFIIERFSTILDPKEFFWKWAYPLLRGLSIALVNPLGAGLGYTAGIPEFVDDPRLKGFSTTNIDSGLGGAAAELGLLGFVIFVYFMVKLGIESIKSWKRLASGLMKDLLIVPTCYSIITVLASVIWQINASLPHSAYQWFLIGMLMKGKEIEFGENSINAAE